MTIVRVIFIICLSFFVFLIYLGYHNKGNSESYDASDALKTQEKTSAPLYSNCDTKVYKITNFVGLTGWLIPENSGFYSDYSTKLPKYPWYVDILDQVGPSLYRAGGRKLPARTKVLVINQSLKFLSYGMYNGILTAKVAGSSKVVEIDVKNFMPVQYWKCPPSKAILYSPFIATIVPKARPIDEKGEWIEVGKEKRVYCNKEFEEKTGCILYNDFGFGYRGFDAVFEDSELKIVF